MYFNVMTPTDILYLTCQCQNVIVTVIVLNNTSQLTDKTHILIGRVINKRKDLTTSIT